MLKAGLRPAANQIFIDFSHPEFELVDFMNENNIAVMAYRPLSFIPHVEMAASMGDASWGKLCALAEAAGSTGESPPRSFVLSWLRRRQITPLFKTAEAERCRANLAAVATARSIPADAFDDRDAEAFGGSEMVDMVGGCDEYARALCSVQPILYLQNKCIL